MIIEYASSDLMRATLAATRLNDRGIRAVLETNKSLDPMEAMKRSVMMVHQITIDDRDEKPAKALLKEAGWLP